MNSILSRASKVTAFHCHGLCLGACKFCCDITTLAKGTRAHITAWIAVPSTLHTPKSSSAVLSFPVPSPPPLSLWPLSPVLFCKGLILPPKRPILLACALKKESSFINLNYVSVYVPVSAQGSQRHQRPRDWSHRQL